MCTTMIITRGATAHRAMVVTHSDDDELSDQRVIRVPAADHAPGSMRPVVAEAYDYPRMVVKDRGPFYDTPGWPLTEPIGEIPQPPHTYAYFDGNYGIANEHGLMMGECTNAAFHQPAPVPARAAGPERHVRIMYSSELSRIALERCTRAREAVLLMGALIDEWGYYGEGETLLVADEDEGWVMEMCALPSQTRHSAWIAQRVPDGEVFVAANTFRIRDVTGRDPDQVHSDHLLEDLRAVGYWDPAKTPVLDWMRAVSPGEYNHPYYSLRRIWRVLDRVNPDLGLSPWVEDTYTRAYPFSVPVARPLTREDIFALYRDHYEGTEFDMTRGIAAGPYGDPHRFVGPYDGKQNDKDEGRRLAGAWERSISVFYQGYSYVLEARPDVPAGARTVMWFAPDVSYTSVFTPFWVNAAALPDSFQIGNPRAYDPEAAWWVFDFLGNWARLNWRRMTEVDIKPVQASLEAGSAALVARVEARIGAAEDPVAHVTEAGIENAACVLAAWRSLSARLIAKYSDGYINPAPDDRKSAIPIGYPSDWLAVTDYADGPVSYDMPVRRRAR